MGDTAVAVNPADDRMKKYIGKKVVVPLIDREVEVIADDYVDISFGTGAVKITPAHDFNDFEVGKRHNLEQVNIMTKTAHLNDNVPEKYRGMDRYEARKAVIEDLKAQGLLVEIDALAITPAQVALAWLLNKKPFIVPIPGTTKLSHLEENLRACDIVFTSEEVTELEKAVAAIPVVGSRYDALQESKIQK